VKQPLSINIIKMQILYT